MYDFVTALEFLTRFHLSKSGEWHDEDFSRSVIWFPLVGLWCGLCLAFVAWGLDCLAVHPLLRSVLLMLAELAVWGGLMYDGFMDTCDGVFSARNRERMLEIMKDSHAGANAVLGACVLLLCKFVCFVILEGWTLILVFPACYAFTRGLMVNFIINFPNPRGNGIGQMFKQYAKGWYVIFALGFGTIVTVVCGWVYLGAAFITGCAGLLTAMFLSRQLGGLTGDTFGFLTQVGEVVFFISVYFIGRVEV